MAQSDPGKGGKKPKKTTVSKGQAASGQRYTQQAKVVKKTTVTTKPSPPRQGPSQQIDYRQRPMTYVPPGTNEVWQGSSYAHPGFELLDSSGAPIPYNAPVTAGGTDTGGGGTDTGGGGGGEPAANPLTWANKYQLPGAPSWWQGLMPSQWTPESEMAAMMNSLIPYLSPEDQRQMGSSLALIYPEAFGGYSPEKAGYTAPTSTLPTSTTQYYQSKKRANEVLSALDTMKSVSGQDESKFGPGYQYLRQLATTLRDFGIDEDDQRMSKRQIMNLYGALDPLLAQSKNSEQLGAYGEIARGLTQPFFTAASMLNVNKDANGNWVFGKANKGWY